ncbi:hypothetical protein IQ221_09825 [Synechocystis salina LEGE 00041]|nr:hypothetical protein [Synechocystis salina]MBE9241286.1 hypothetical protein [Synechocystis salina LEGE 00041]
MPPAMSLGLHRAVAGGSVDQQAVEHFQVAFTFGYVIYVLDCLDSILVRVTIAMAIAIKSPDGGVGLG